MGKRYGLLPSELLKRADSFDLMTFDVSMSYQLWKSKEGTPEVNKMYDPKQLEEAMKKHKEKYG